MRIASAVHGSLVEDLIKILIDHFRRVVFVGACSDHPMGLALIAIRFAVFFNAVAIVQRDRQLRWHSATPCTVHSLLRCSLDSVVDLLQRCRVRLRDQQGHAVLFLPAHVLARLEDVAIRESYFTCGYCCLILITHCCFPPYGL